MEVILFPHTHWDREWYKPFQDFRIRLGEVIELLINEIEQGELEYFYLDGQTVILEDYAEIYQEKARNLEKLIKDKKIFVGPWYVLADEFLVSGESLIRNLLIGINHAAQYGCTDYFGYLPDSFGHNSQIPQILSSFNINNTVLWRGVGDKNSEFIWETDNISKIMATYLIEGYFQDILHRDIPIEQMAKEIEQLLDRIKSKTTSNKILLPVGGDHLGPAICLKDKINKLNNILTGYKLKQGNINEYFSGINTDKKGLKQIKGEFRDNSRNPILPGTLSTRLYLKQMNAVSTWKLSRIAEPLCSFLNFSGQVKNRKNELDYAWKLLLKNHPHDSICGCSRDDVHEENVCRFTQVNQITDALISRCINDVTDNFTEKKPVVYNLSNYSYSGIVTIKTMEKLPENPAFQFVGMEKEFPEHILLDTQRAPVCEDIKEIGKYLVYTENIPAFSVKHLTPAAPPSTITIENNKINNSLVEINVNPDGAIDLIDKENNKIFRQLHIITNRADIGDTYNYSPIKEENPIKAEFIKSEIKEKGHLRSILKLSYNLKIPECYDRKKNKRSAIYADTEVTTEIIITAGSKRVEFITSLENRCKDHIIQIKFNLPEKITETVAENTFGLITRKFDPDYCIEDLIPAEKGKELRTNSAPMQRFVFAQGLGIITEGLPEYVISKNSLNLSILRAVNKLSDISLATRAFPAGPPITTPEAQCLGKLSVRYALCPANSPEILFKEADEFMKSTFASIRDISHCKYDLNQQFLKVSNNNILIYGVKLTENRDINGIVLRAFNISEKEEIAIFSSDLGFTGLREINSLEDKLSEDYNVNNEIFFKPGELKSLMLYSAKKNKRL